MSKPQTRRPARSGSRRTWGLTSWYGLMVLGGLGFGLLADRRPFGEGFLVHPLVVFFALVGLGLLALRVLLAQPVPNVISDRALFAGCIVGLVAFLVGNFLGVYIIARLN